MKAILYMTRKSIKNWFLDLLRHPTKLIGVVLLVVIIGFSVLNVLFSSDYSESMGTLTESGVDIGILHGIYFLLLFFLGGTVILKGLKSGTTFFTMGDVNMMFCSPISPKSLLVFGLVRQMLTMLLMAIIFLVYGGMAKSIFDLTTAQAVILIISFFLFLIISQIVALFLYSTTNGKPKAISAAKYILYALILLPVVLILIPVIQNGFTLSSLYGALKSPAAEFVPLFGWMKGFTFGILSGNVITSVVYGVLMLLVVGLSLVFFMKADCDYYEDVLQNTETSHEMRQAVKKRGMNNTDAYLKNRKIRIGSKGLNGGKGASTFLFKHLLERRRSGYVLFWDMYSIIMIAVCGFVSFFIVYSGDDGEALTSEATMLILLAMASYMQLFFSVTGDWARELSKPYIYMIPDSPFKKLIFASLTSIIKPFLDGVLLFVVAGIICSASPLVVISSIIVYTSFSCIYCTVNILTDRVLGFLSNQALSMFLFIMISLIAVAPGVILAFVIGAVSGAPLWLAACVCALWNFIVSLVLALICKNTLHNMEMPF